MDFDMRRSKIGVISYFRENTEATVHRPLLVIVEHFKCFRSYSRQKTGFDEVFFFKKVAAEGKVDLKVDELNKLKSEPSEQNDAFITCSSIGLATCLNGIILTAPPQTTVQGHYKIRTPLAFVVINRLAKHLQIFFDTGAHTINKGNENMNLFRY